MLTSAVLPRPIALVSSCKRDGSGRNIAPFSYFNIVSHKPPVLMVSCNFRRGGKPKDTLVNVLDAREFVINTVSEAMMDETTCASGDYPYGEDEFLKCGMVG